MALSDTKLRTLKTTGATYKASDAGGLYLEVTAYGDKSGGCVEEARRLQSGGLEPVVADRSAVGCWYQTD